MPDGQLTVVDEHARMGSLGGVAVQATEARPPENSTRHKAYVQG